MEKDESSVKSAKDIVIEYLQAADRRDFQSARDYLSDNISYVSPLNSFDRAEPYLKYFEHVFKTSIERDEEDRSDDPAHTGRIVFEEDGEVVKEISQESAPQSVPPSTNFKFAFSWGDP